MQSNRCTPVERWNSTAQFFATLTENSDWVRLTPMIDLCRWAGGQDFAKDLFPLTSLHVLCVHTKPGYNPDAPFFSCECTLDSSVKFVLWAEVGQQVKCSRAELTELRKEFADYAKQLLKNS